MMHSCDDRFFCFLFQNGTFSAMTSGGTTKSAVPGAVAPDGGWGWIIVLASFMIHFIMDGSVNSNQTS